VVTVAQYLHSCEYVDSCRSMACTCARPVGTDGGRATQQVSNQTTRQLLFALATRPHTWICIHAATSTEGCVHAVVDAARNSEISVSQKYLWEMKVAAMNRRVATRATNWGQVRPSGSLTILGQELFSGVHHVHRLTRHAEAWVGA
jgi:hypothetical protein